MNRLSFFPRRQSTGWYVQKLGSMVGAAKDPGVWISTHVFEAVMVNFIVNWVGFLRNTALNMCLRVQTVLPEAENVRD